MVRAAGGPNDHQYAFYTSACCIIGVHVCSNKFLDSEKIN